MKAEKNSVLWYTHATLPVSFPEDRVVCQNCPALGIEYHLDRQYCKSTGEFLLNPKHTRGGMCPLHVYKEGSDEQISDA